MFKQSTIKALRALAKEYPTQVKTSEIGSFRSSWNDNLSDPSDYLSTEIFNVKKKLGMSGQSLNPSEAIQKIDSGELPESPAPKAKSQPQNETPKTESGLKSVFGDIPKVPSKKDTYVPFGVYSKISKVMKSELPMTVWVTGEKGYGKTLSIIQSAAAVGKPISVMSITSETTEDDLVGGLRIVDGSTVFQKSQLIWCMQNGYPILLDEIDLGGSRIMALQGVLDHTGILIKKTGEFIKPAPGFQVFLTSNTKGNGDMSDRYVHTQIMNSAFLDRIDTILEHKAPTETVEQKIIEAEVKALGIEDRIKPEEIKHICAWASFIRENVQKGLIVEEISTRALTKVVKNMAVFGGNVISNITKVIQKSEDDEWIESITRFYRDIVSDQESTQKEDS